MVAPALMPTKGPSSDRHERKYRNTSFGNFRESAWLFVLLCLIRDDKKAILGCLFP